MSLDECFVHNSVSTDDSLSSPDLSKSYLLSDVSTTSTDSTSFAFSFSTEEGDKSEGIGKEAVIEPKLNDTFFLSQRNSILEYENRKIQQDLKLRQQEVRALVKRCNSQGKIIKGTIDAKVMRNEIKQLSDEIEHKDVIIEKLKDELTKMKKSYSSDDKVVKPKVEKESKDIGIIDSLNSIKNIDSNPKRQEPNQSHHFQLHLLQDTDKVDGLEQLLKVSAEKHGVADKQKKYFTEMEKELAERALLIERVQHDLKLREQEVSALVKRCDLQGKIIKATRDAKVIPKAIEQLSDEKECKDGNIEIFKDEIREGKEEAPRALEEMKKAEVLNCTKICTLQNKETDIEKKSQTKPKIETVLKNNESKDSQSAIGTTINSDFVRKEPNQSLYFKLHLLNLSVLKTEIDQLKIQSVKQNTAEHLHLAQISAVKDEIIEQQKGHCRDMEKELSERDLVIDEMVNQNKELEQQLKHLKNSQSKSDDLDDDTDFKTLETTSGPKRTTLSRMLSNLNTMRKIVNEKDEVIKEKDVRCSHMEMDLAEKSRIIYETLQQRKNLEDDLRKTQKFTIELEESQLCPREIHDKVTERKTMCAQYAKQSKPEPLQKEKGPEKKLKHRIGKLSSKLLRSKASQLRPTLGNKKVMTMNSSQLKR